MSEFVPDPSNYTMKGNNVPKHIPVETNVIGADTLAQLEDMPREALISLVKRMARQCGMVAMMSEEHLRTAFLDRMAHIGLTGKPIEAMTAMEKRMDRIEGKPMQRLQSLVAVSDVSKPMPANDRAALEHYFKIRGFKDAESTE